MRILFSELPQDMQTKIKEFIQKVQRMHPDRNTIRVWPDEEIFTYPSFNQRVSANNDYSTTVIQFYNVRNNRVIPVRDKLPDVPRKSVGIEEYKGALSFDGLGDSYNIDYGTYYEKLARGVPISLSRQEVMFAYNVQYQSNYFTIRCTEDSPILNKDNILMNYSDMTAEEIVGISLFFRKNHYPSYKIQNIWRAIFGEDSWSFSNEIIIKLLNRRLIKKGKIPKITQKGITFIKNLASEYRREFATLDMNAQYNDKFDKAIEWYNSNKGKKLEDFVKE